MKSNLTILTFLLIITLDTQIYCAMTKEESDSKSNETINQNTVDFINFLLNSRNDPDKKARALDILDKKKILTNFQSIVEWIEPGSAKTVTPLCLAITEGHADIVQRLLDLNAPVNQIVQGRNDEYCYAIHLAARHASNEIVKSIINAKADLNNQDFLGKTAIFYAIKREYIPVIRLLLNSDASLMVKDKRNKVATDFINKEKEEIQNIVEQHKKQRFNKSVPIISEAASFNPGIAKIIAEYANTANY